MAKKEGEQVRDLLIDVVMRNLGLQRDELQEDVSLDSYGADSMQWANIAYELGVSLGRRISPEEIAACGSVSGMYLALTKT